MTSTESSTPRDFFSINVIDADHLTEAAHRSIEALTNIVKNGNTDQIIQAAHALLDAYRAAEAHILQVNAVAHQMIQAKQDE